MMILAAYLAINVYTFCLYGVDKRRAIRGEWRIPEKKLLSFTWGMGGIGAVLGMRVFHHKTLHKQFAIGAPCAAVLQIAFLAWLFADGIY